MDLPLIFLSYNHEAMGRPAGYKEVVSAIERGLEGKAEVFRDVLIGSGEEWLAEIDAKLDRCVAAIVLLSQEVKVADWVHYELTALSRRRRLESDFPLIPVTFDLSGRDLVEGKFETAKLGELATIAHAGDAAKTAEGVLAALGDLSRFVDGPPLKSWVTEVAMVLGQAQVEPTDLISEAPPAAMRHIRSEDRAHARKAMARFLYSADREKIRSVGVGLVSAMKDTKPRELKTLGRLLRHLWLDERYTSGFSEAHVSDTPGGVVVARLSDIQAGRDHVARVWLVWAHHRQIDVGVLPDEQVMADLAIRLVDTLTFSERRRKELPCNWETRLAESEVAGKVARMIDVEIVKLAKDEPSVPVVLILPAGYGGRPALVSRIHGLYPSLLLLLLERDSDLIDGACMIANKNLLLPELSIEDEAAGLDWADRLVAMMTPRMPSV